MAALSRQNEFYFPSNQYLPCHVKNEVKRTTTEETYCTFYDNYEHAFPNSYYISQYFNSNDGQYLPTRFYGQNEDEYSNAVYNGFYDQTMLNNIEHNQLTPTGVNEAIFTAPKWPSKNQNDTFNRQSVRRRKKQNSEVRIRINGRYRTPYDDYVKNVLESEFNNNKYITATRKAELAPQLQLTNRQIKIWFQNRRAKERKLQKRTIKLTL